MAGHIVSEKQIAAFFKRDIADRRAAKARLDGSQGAAGPCKRIDPRTGEASEIVALASAGVTTAAPVIGVPKKFRTAKPGSLRKRRCRVLQKAGGAAPHVPCKDIAGTIELLLDLGWLPEHASEDHREIGKAAGRLLDDLTSWANGKRGKYGPAWTDHIRLPWSDPEHEQ